MVSSTLVLQLCRRGEGVSRSSHDRVTSPHYKKSKAVTVHIFGHTSIMEISELTCCILIHSSDALGIFELRKEVEVAQESRVEVSPGREVLGILLLGVNRPIWAGSTS